MLKKILIISIILSTYISRSQDRIKVNYSENRIDTLIEKYRKSNHYKKIWVYRIQLESGEKPEKIKHAKDEYLKIFPLEIVEEVFEPPFFKAITGVFSDKKQAEKKLLEIKKKFKNSFIFQDLISMDVFKEAQILK
tara:strand:+ start:277 stop:684 length:408 start_codon:yes stop_codon:yes gene_type:complete